MVVSECSFCRIRRRGLQSRGRFRGRNSLPWWYILVGNRLLRLSTWGSSLSIRMVGDILGPSFNRAADTVHDPLIQSGSTSGSVPSRALAAAALGVWRLGLRRTDEPVGFATCHCPNQGLGGSQFQVETRIRWWACRVGWSRPRGPIARKLREIGTSYVGLDTRDKHNSE